jgi:hypothetical protein
MDLAIPDALVTGHKELFAGLTTAQRQRQHLKHPPVGVDEFLETLLRQGLVQTSKSLATYRAIL